MSELIIDTITGKSTATTITIGSTPVVSSSANSMTIRGEGSNQTSIQQGLAKSWIAFIGTSTISVSDSFNLSSLVDDEAGTYTANFNNNMSSNEDYCWSFGVKDGTTQGRGRYMNPRNASTYSASAFQMEFQNDDSNTMQDVDHGSLIIHGDLA
jgi:hypothetical protein